jgi:multimeric flavodoxin WrbA
MKPLRILGICGSPRKGNTLFLLKKALRAAKEASEDTQTCSVSLRRKQVVPCNSCFWCVSHGGECKIKDDFQELRNKWLEAHVILYAFPVYHMSIPGQLKCFIDRLGQSGSYLYETPVRRLKAIGAITQGKHLYGGQDLALSFILHHAVLMRCIPVAGDGGISYIGSAGWSFDERDKNAIEDHFETGDTYAMSPVQAAENIGRRAVEMADIVRTGILAKKERFSKDPSYVPFLKHISDL